MNQIKIKKERVFFLIVLVLFVSTNIFAFDATFNYSDNISLNFNLKDIEYSFNITKVNITIYNSSNNIIFSQENESESINFHDISIPIFIENQYNPSKELYTLSPGSYTVEIFGYDFFNNIKNQNFSFEILKPEFLQNDFIFEIDDNIKYATNFSIDIKNKNNIPYKINKIVLTTNDYTIITHCSIKNISYYKNIQENYASDHGYEYFYSGIQDLYCENAPFEEQHLLSKFKNEKLKLLLNVTSAFSQNILLIKDNISSDFKLKFEINPINFNETSWNVIGKNKEMIFEIKTNNELGGKINDTINEFNDDESREFRLNENNLYVYNSFFNFSDYKFYYTYGFNYPNENQSILFNKPYNISELEYIDENYFSSLNPIPIFQTNHEIVNRSGLGYVFINYTKNKSDNLRLIPKMDNGYYDPLIFYNFDMVYDNVNPEINITNINESSLIVQYANKKIYVRIEDKNIPKCDDFDFFQMRIYANEEIIIKEPYKVLLNLTDKNGNEVSNFTINLTVSNIDKTINIPIIEESTSDLREYLNIFDFSNENFQINGIIYENPEENYYNYTFSDIISEKVGNDYYFKIQMNDYPMSCETFGIRTGYNISKVCGLNEVCGSINNIYYGEDECCYSKDPEYELEYLCVTLEDSEDDEVISEDFIIPTQNPREFPEDKFFTCNNAELREGEGFQDGVYLTFNSDLDEDFTYNISVVVFDKGYNRNEINYTNITISELDYKFEINNKNDLNEIFLAKNYYDKFYLKEGKFNALIRYSQSNNPKYEENDAEINITIKNSLGSTIENLECYYIKPPTTEKYNEENDFYYNETLQEFINDGFIYECNNTIALNEGKYSIIKKIYNSSNTSQIYSEDYILTNNFLTIDKQNPIIDTENLGNKIQRIEKEFFYKFKISDNEGYSVSDIHYELKRKDECQILSDLEIQDGYYKLKIKCDKENIGNTDLIINVTDYAGNFKAEEIDLQVAELKIIPEIKIDSQNYALDSNKIYLYNFQEVNYSIEFHHNHGLNLTNLDCSIFYKNNENTQTSSSINSSNSKILTIYDNKNIQTVSELKYSCIAYDENQERYDFDIEYDFDIFGIYSINLLSNKLFLNKLFEFELYTISDINLSSSKFKLYYLEEEIKDFECVSFGFNKYLCNLTLSSNDLKIYENILDGFNSDSLPKFDLKAEIDFYDEEIYDIKVTKKIDWDFYKTQIIDDEDIIIPLENITDMKHFYCDKNLTCVEEIINLEDYENGFYFLNSSQRNEIDAYSFSNNSLIESLIFLKSNNLYKNPIDLTNKKECNFEVLKDKLNDNSQYGKYIIYKTNCDPQISFKYDFINYNYLDDIYYLKLNSSSQEDDFVLSIMIDDIIFNKEIKNYNLGENKEIYISSSNSNLLKKIDIFDLFYKDNSINRYYEKSNNNFKKLELNSSYDS
ncbi:MAG: hypothetical protein PHT94_03475, partial [Candidatus Nanoarchaeia archaeon]|nr:hypothetical protein [Candidatus Nanoarchaeia archaeon]